MNSIVYLIYLYAVRFKRSKLSMKFLHLENANISRKEQLKKYHRKGADLKKILMRYPIPAEQQT